MVVISPSYLLLDLRRDHFTAHGSTDTYSAQISRFSSRICARDLPRFNNRYFLLLSLTAQSNPSRFEILPDWLWGIGSRRLAVPSACVRDYCAHPLRSSKPTRFTQTKISLTDHCTCSGCPNWYYSLSSPNLSAQAATSTEELRYTKYEATLTGTGIGQL